MSNQTTIHMLTKCIDNDDTVHMAIVQLTEKHQLGMKFIAEIFEENPFLARSSIKLLVNASITLIKNIGQYTNNPTQQKLLQYEKASYDQSDWVLLSDVDVQKIHADLINEYCEWVELELFGLNNDPVEFQICGTIDLRYCKSRTVELSEISKYFKVQ